MDIEQSVPSKKKLITLLNRIAMKAGLSMDELMCGNDYKKWSADELFVQYRNFYLMMYKEKYVPKN